MNDLKDVALAFAKEQGFDGFRYVKKWKGYDVFLVWDKSNEGACVGMPIYIIVNKSGKVRYSNIEETEGIMGLKHAAPKDFGGEFIG